TEVPVSYHRDEAGRAGALDRGALHTEWHYDALGRLSNITHRFGAEQPLLTLAYSSYDARNRILARDTNSGVSCDEIEYDGYDQLTGAQTNARRVFSYGYDGGNRGN